MAKRFLGLWKLIPSSCKYDVGQAPLKATYRFSRLPQNPEPQDPIHITVDIHWTDISKQNQSASYQIHLTKTIQLEEHMGMKLQVQHELTKEGVLKSTTYSQNGDVKLMESLRELKEQGKILDVLMLTNSPKGQHKIFQKYEKTQE